MPSPFPGMDPYLESPRVWRDVHHSLISVLRRSLNDTLPEEFVATIEERLYVAASPDALRPDVAVVRFATAPANPPASGGAVTLLAPAAEAGDAPVILRGAREVVREASIHIVPADEPERVITAIEVVSPTNKATADGRRQYLRKQERVLDSGTHLLEVDLLRDGPPLVLAAMGLRETGEGWDYLVSLSRANNPDIEAWPVDLRDRLPVCRVPLTDDYPDVLADLQMALAQTYDEGRFRRRVDYSAPPDPPLSPEGAAWADTVLRDKGLRS